MRTARFVCLLVFVMAANGSAQKSGSAPAVPSADQRAPKGMCRIWLKDVPAAHQPAPTDCAAAVKNCPPNGRVIFGDDPSGTQPKADSVARDSKGSPVVKSSVDRKKQKPPATDVVQRKPPR